MTFDVFNPVRSFRAAYALFIVAPLLVFASVVALSWLTLQIAPAFPPLALVSTIFQYLLGQLIILVGAGLPAWHWSRQLRHRCGGITIAVIAIAHYLFMQWWCWLGYDVLRGHSNAA
jgi:hypothetical protein